MSAMGSSGRPIDPSRLQKRLDSLAPAEPPAAAPSEEAPPPPQNVPPPPAPPAAPAEKAEARDPLTLEAPRTVKDLGVSKEMVMPLVLKTAFLLNTFSSNELAERLRLPVRLAGELIEEWKELKCCEVLHSTSHISTARRYAMTSEGQKRAREYLQQRSYVGPVPVPVSLYRDMVEDQSVLKVNVADEDLRKAFSHLIVAEKTIELLGPAVNSGRSIFIYGPPGNGKTAIAASLAPLLGGTVCIPHAIEIGGFTMRLYDPSIHKLSGEQPADRRWLRCKRPVVFAGGELTLETLDLVLFPNSNTYEAPPHVKSNNGIFVLDDFGRQKVRPRDLLNRWIVPLENRVDYLNLHTGGKVQLPFDQLIIFSTNLHPSELVDEAFMRRIRYKVFVGPLSEPEFLEAFRRIARARGIEFSKEGYDLLVNQIYRARNLPFTACHPRDIIENLIDLAKYEGVPPSMNTDLLMRACETYFINPSDDYASPAGTAG